MKNVLKKINKETIKKGISKYNRGLEIYDKFNKDPIKKFVFKKLHEKFSYSISASTYIDKRDNDEFSKIIYFIEKINNPKTNKMLIYDEDNNLITDWCNNGNYTILYKNHIIEIISTKDDNSIVDMRQLTITIYGINFNIILDEIKMARNLILEENREGAPTYTVINWRDGNSTRLIPDKSKLFIDKLEYLDDYVSKWIKAESIYSEYNITHKLGIMLHGVGGTGKTTIVEYLAAKYSGKLVKVNAFQSLFNIKECVRQYANIALNNNIKRKKNGEPIEPVIFLIDDFERAVIDREDVTENSKDHLSDREEKLNYFLSLLDGTDSLNYCIFIATTNHYDSLDKALKRPGRFDIRLEINPLDIDRSKELIDFYLSKVIDNIDYDSIFKKIKANQDPDYKYKDEDLYTPAELKAECVEILLNETIRK